MPTTEPIDAKLRDVRTTIDRIRREIASLLLTLQPDEAPRADRTS